MQAVLDLVWDKLLPAMKPSPLATDPDAHKKLEQTLAGLSLEPAHGSATPSLAKLSKKKYVFPSNRRHLEAITVDSDNSGAVTLIARINGTNRAIECGRGEWKKSRIAFGPLAEQPAAASGAGKPTIRMSQSCAFMKRLLLSRSN